uniref:Ribonuclease H-like domain-containing protein n=1 Tax=Tanacetum cinerariifolium TaxID=118510 RepID=A0A699I460_TANCI|nr:ribonuclease H-like domain-containing protein [Tanacetum cinerariifolium]
MERKSRTTLLLALLEDHLAKFHKMADAKEMWEAIKSKFDSNDESKKMQKYLLKQQFEGFSVSALEGLHKGYDRFQTLLSQLEIHGVGISHEDANQKFLRSLPSSWSQVALIMRTKPGLDTFSFDDLYSNLRVFERDVKGTTTSSSNTQNVAFVFADNTSSTNDVSTAYSVSSPSVSKSQKEGSSSYIDEVIHSFFANQSSAPQLDYDDLEKINDADIEEMDLKWQVAMISMRIKKFHKRTGRKLQFDTKDLAGFNKTKVECFNCHKIGHFARDCKAKGNQNSRRRDVGYNGNKARDNVENAPKVVCEPKVWIDTPIIKEYESDSDNDSVSIVQEDKEKPSFAFTESVKNVKTSKENVKESCIPNHCPKVEKHDKNGPLERVSVMPLLEKHALFVDNLYKALKDKGIVDSGCSRHMIGNKAHIADYQEFKGGSVAFGGYNGRITSKAKIKAGRLKFEDVYYVEELKHYNLFSVSQMCDKKNKVLFIDTDCLVLSLDFKLPDENQVLLKIPRQHNMYSFNLKNIDPSGDLACLFAKSSIDESNKWHRRLGHVNFKNLNKLVKGNIIRGLPSKIFENDHTCVACQKGKQHKASLIYSFFASQSSCPQLDDEDLKLIDVDDLEEMDLKWQMAMLRMRAR